MDEQCKPPETIALSSYENACNYAAHERRLRIQSEEHIRRLNARIHLQRQEIRMLHKKLAAPSAPEQSSTGESK